MPNSATFSALVDTATKCFATAASSPRAASAQSRALCALVIVSSVVNVFEQMMNSVSAGSRSRVASTKSVPSTFETNRNVRLRRLKCRSASYAITGPRSEPPMPMLTTLRIGLPVWPVHDPSRTRVGEAAHPAEHLVHVRHDVVAVHLDHLAGRRPQSDVQHRAVLGRR